MAKLILKSIDYYPVELTSMPEAHKVLGRIDTDLPYKKLVVAARTKQLYRLVDESTGQVLKQQKLVRDLDDLKIYVGQVIVVELKDFFSFQHALAEQTSDQPLYMVDAGETSCVAGLITPNDASTLPELYVMWEPGMSVANCLNPEAMALQPFAGLGGISGLTLSSLSGLAAAVGLSSLSSIQSSGTASVVYPKLSGSIFQGPVIGQAVNGTNVSGLKVQAFDSSGKSLGIADVKADGSYELTLTNAAYKGALVLKVYDDSTDSLTPKFRDEATGTEKNFTTLLAVINYQGNAITTTTVNVTALTNLAAVKAGVTVTASGVSVPAQATTSTFESANTSVAQKFLGSNTSLFDDKLSPSFNSDGAPDNSNKYNNALSLLSFVEQVSGKTTAEAASMLANILDSTDTNSTDTKNSNSILSQAAAYAAKAGVTQADLNNILSSVTNNTPATGSVSISNTATNKTTPQEGDILSVKESQFVDANNTKADQSFSTSSTYQWQSSGDKKSWTNIDKATSTNFSVTQDQVNTYLRVLVKNTDSKGFDEFLVSDATAKVINLNQEPGGSLNISVSNNGSLQQNSMLQLTDALTDTDGLGTRSYQWQSSATGNLNDWKNIDKAIYETYTLTQAEVDKKIRVMASYTDAMGTQEVFYGAATAAIANVNDLPQGAVMINGQDTPNQNFSQNEKLTASNTLSDPDNNGTPITGVTYQWQNSADGNGWNNIANATSVTYTLAQSDVDKKIRVVANYTDATQVRESKASEITGAVHNVNDLPVGTVAIDGSFTENQIPKVNEKDSLTARVNLTDADNNGVAIADAAYSYQWQTSSDGSTNWTNIGGNAAKAKTFTPTNAEVDTFLRVIVSYTDTGGYSNSKSSDAVKVKNVNDALLGNVTVSGANNAAAAYTQSATLYASNTFTDDDGMDTVNYQWQNSTNGTDWSDIATASASNYTLTQSDVGKYVRVHASYTDLHGTLEAKDSSSSLVSNENDPPVGTVLVAGQMKQGVILQASNTLTDADNMGTVNYQWQVSSNKKDWTDIAQATGASFTLTQQQTGQYVRVKASYIDGGNTTETVYNDISSNTTVLDVMEAPVLSASTASQVFTEARGLNQQADPKGGVFANAQLSDAEINNITSMQFSVSGLIDGTDEKLFINGTAVTLTASPSGAELVSGVGLSVVMSGPNNSIATVTLSNANGWNLADAQSLIASVAYQNTNKDKPTPGDRSIALLQLVDNGVKTNLDDSNTANFSANTALTAKVTVQAVNDAPVLNGQSPATPVFNENGSAVTVNPAISISDVDTALMKSAIVKINSGYVSGDSLSVNLAGLDTGDISVTAFNAATQQLVFNSAAGASTTQWQNALRAVKFISTSDNPGTTRSIDFVVNDGTDNSLALTTTVTVTPVNDAPVLSNASTTLAYTENNSTAIQPGITASDADNAVPVKVTVAFINSSFVSAEDQLLFTSSASTGNIAAAWDAVAGTLTLTSLNNSATLSQWNAAMQAVSYKNLSDTPNTSNRSISFTANDGTDDSVAAVTTVSVTAVNDAPVLAAVSKNAAYTEPTGTGGASPLTVFGANSLSLTDAENNSIKAFSLNISGVSDSTEVLNIDGTDIALTAGTRGTTTGVNAFDYSVTSTGTQFTIAFSKTSNFVAISTVKNLLEAMTYNNTNANNPTAGDRVVSVATVQDSGGGTDTYQSSGSSVAKSTVTVTATNDAPVLAAVSKNAAYTEPSGVTGASPVAVFGTGSLTLTDAENNSIKAFSLNITGVSDSTEVLSIDGSNISLTDAGTGTTSGNSFTYSVASTGAQTFTVSFSKSSNYVDINTVKSLLEAMTYNNTNANNPTAGDRVISVATVQDSGGGTDTYQSSGGSVAKSTVTVSATNDAPVNTVPGSTVSVGYNSSTYITGLGVSDADAGAATTFSVKLTVNKGTLSLSSLSGVDITGNSTNSVTLTGMVADIHTLLRTANAVKYTAPADTGGSFTLTMTSNDAGNSGSGAGTDVVSTLTITVNQPPVLSTLASKIATATEDTEIEITADMLKTNTIATDAEDSTVNAFVVKSIASGTTVRIGTSSAAATDWNSTNAVVDGTRKLYWKAAQNANGTGLSAFTVAAKDSVGAESSTTAAITLDVTAVNDAPKFTNSPAAASVSTNMNTAYALPTGYSVDDVDAGNSANLKLSFTLKEGANASGSLAYALGGSGVTWVSTTGNVYTFSGSLAQLNAWMNTANFLTYTPTSGFMGAATIAMAIDDQGNTGSGSAISTNAANALTINVKDVTAPLLQSVSTSSDGSKIILTYNEALSNTTAVASNFTYKLNNGTSYTPNSVTVNGSTIELNLTANKPVFGDTVSVNYTAPTPDTLPTNLSVQDSSGNDAVAIANNNSVTFTNSVTNIAPTLSTTPVTNLIPNNAFTVNGTSNVTPVTVNGRTVELTLAAGVPINAPITLAYTNSNTSKAIQDTTGNDAAGIATALTIPVAGYTAPSETLVPTLISATLSADRKTVILTYSESLDTTKPLVPGNFTVFAGADYTASSPTSFAVSSAVVNASNPNTVVLTLSAASGIPNNLPFVTATYAPPTPADNTLANSVVQDPTGNDAASFSRLLVPTTNYDNVLPVLRTVAVSSSGGVNKLIMTYSEALNNASNFTEGTNSSQGTAVSVFSSATVNAGAGETTQNIAGLSFTVTGLKDGTDEKITVDGTTITLTNGTAGTTSSIAPNNAMSYTVAVSGSTATVTLTKAAGITATQAQNLLTGITYQNTNIDNPTPGLRVFDIASITDSSGAAIATSTFAAGINSSTVLVTALNDAPTFTSSTVATVSVPTSNSQAASKAFNIPMNGFVMQDKDGGNTIETLTFTMTDLAASSPAFAPLNLNFPVGATSLYATKVSDNTYSVYGTVADMNYWLQQTNAISYNPRVGTTSAATPNSIAKLSTLRIKDTFGAFADSGSSTATTNIPVTADTQAPALRSAVLSSEANNKIILNFDEPLNATVDLTALKSSFTISGNSISTASISGSSVILTTSSNVSSGVAVTYTDNAGAAAIQDAAGVHATTQTMRADSDASAPALTGSMVYYNGSGSALNKFVLNFSEDMSSVCAAPSQFSVYISDPVYPDRTGTAVISSTVFSGGASSYGNNTVTFGINTNFLSPNASVSVTYTDPTTGNDVSAIQDVAGNDLGNMVLGAWTNDNLVAVNSYQINGVGPLQNTFTAGKAVLVVGGQGNDTMTGGLANDTFTWFAGDAGATGAVDVVKSFGSNSSSDKLDISKLLTGYTGGTNLSQWVTSVTNNASGAPTGVSATNTKIVIDVDGQPAVGAAAGAAGTGTVTQTIWLDGVNLTLVSGTLDTQLTALKNSGVLIA